MRRGGQLKVCVLGLRDPCGHARVGCCFGAGVLTVSEEARVRIRLCEPRQVWPAIQGHVFVFLSSGGNQVNRPV
jgi:hypothetical protein